MVNKIKHFNILLFFITSMCLAPLVHSRVFLGGNDASRFAQIEALIDYGHSYINESQYSQTLDRVTINGKDYSNKPPLLSVIGAIVYFLIKNIIGFTFAKNEAAVVYLLTFVLVVIPTSWLVSGFYASLKLYEDISFGVRFFTTIALAFGTILMSFSVTLNNHTVGAAILFSAFMAAFEGSGVKAGTLTALAACIDIVPGTLFIPVFAHMIYDKSGRGALIRYSIPLIIGALIFVAINICIVGYPLTPKLVSGGIDFSNPIGSPTIGKVLLPDTLSYPLECLFGWHGFFTVSPVLIFGFIGLITATRFATSIHLWAYLSLAASVVVMIVGHVLFVGSYGGWSYGFRYLIPIIPIIMFFAPLIVKRHFRIFSVTLAVSVLFAFVGAYNPWPPAYEQELNKDPVASVVTNPIGANMSALMEKYFPGYGITKKMKSMFISPSKKVQTQYLILFYMSKGDTKMEGKMRTILEATFRHQTL